MMTGKILLICVLLAVGIALFGQYRRSHGLVFGDPVDTWMSDETCKEGDHVIFGFTEHGTGPVLLCEETK